MTGCAKAWDNAKTNTARPLREKSMILTNLKRRHEKEAGLIAKPAYSYIFGNISRPSAG